MAEADFSRKEVGMRIFYGNVSWFNSDMAKETLLIAQSNSTNG